MRLDSALPEVTSNADGTTSPSSGANGQQVLLPKTATSQSGRLYVGLKHAFSSQVTFTTGIEYLQAFAASSGSSSDYRINYDALFAANLAGGFALGLGFSARYDHTPIPGKEDLDTSSTVSLIYSFSDAVAAAAAPTCPCTPPQPLVRRRRSRRPSAASRDGARRLRPRRLLPRRRLRRPRRRRTTKRPGRVPG